MTEYGVVPTGFNRKPLAVILAEMEAKNQTEFGPQVVQTPQSPLGQINGLMADLVSELWELAEDIYQSYDPDQSEGVRLDMLGRVRLLTRNGLSDARFRQAITNDGQGRIDLQDLAAAIAGVAGVSYSRVFINETGEIDFDVLERGTVAVAVLGGDDADLAETLRKYIAPGVSTYGNTRVTTLVDGFCRSMSIIRPVEIEVNVTVQVQRRTDEQNCPPPSVDAIATFLESEWARIRSNGLDPSFYTVRSLLERQFSNVEVVTVTGERDGNSFPTNQPVTISFTEIAKLKATVTSVSSS